MLNQQPNWKLHRKYKYRSNTDENIKKSKNKKNTINLTENQS